MKERPSRLEKGVSLFLFWMFLLTRYSLATPRLYTTSYANNSVYAPFRMERGVESTTFPTEQTTRLLVNQSTRQLYLITILNCEL